MSKFFSEKYASLVPYTPGEQPRDMQYIKLNTNESPYPPSQKAQDLASEAAKRLHLYPDPECTALVNELASIYNVKPSQILLTNGSDEILNFAFMAFCDSKTPAIFADITYGFYKVFAQINCLPYVEVPLNDDFTLNKADYFNTGKTVFIANPNAPTGLALSLDDIEEIVKANPNNVVVIDEAYVDFGAQSAVTLVNKYDNLLVTGTFSKSRSLAGGRLGFGIGNKELISDLNTIKYSTNPYNVNRMTQAAGVAAAVAVTDNSTVHDVNIERVQDILVEQDVPLPRRKDVDPAYTELLEQNQYGLYTELAKIAKEHPEEIFKYRQG